MNITMIECPSCGADVKIVKSGANTCGNCFNVFYVEDKQGDVIVNTTINNFNDSYRYRTKEKSSRGIWAYALFYLIGVLSIAGFIAFNITKDKLVSPLPSASYSDRVHSDYMVSFVERAFGKNISDITAEDYGQINYLRFKNLDNETFVINYKFNGDSTLYAQKFARKLINDKSIPFYDFQCFSNLVVLDFNDSDMVDRYYMNSDSPYPNDLKNLKKLEVYGGQRFSTIEDYPDILYNVSNLLYISGNIYSPNKMAKNVRLFENVEFLKIDSISDEAKGRLSMLSDFKNLKALHVHAYENNDYLSSLVNLEELKLDLSWNVKGYDVLYGLSKLKRLEISDADQLKSIDFISAMPNLEVLSIDDSIIKNIDVLAKVPNLVELHLKSNTEIRDYTPIESLSNLKILSLNIWSTEPDMKFPNLSKLSKLEHLGIESFLVSRVNIPDFIKTLEVRIQLTGKFDLDNISHIKSLEIFSSTGDGELKNAKVLNKLTNLQEFYSNKTRLNSFDLADLLNSKSLKLIDIYKSNFITLSEDALMDNEVLETLAINDLETVSLLKSGESTKKKFSEQSQILGKLHALKHLALIECEIDDISFASSLENLVYVDLSNNYVSDVSPLAKLKNLGMAVMVDNPVSNAKLLDGRIFVN